MATCRFHLQLGRSTEENGVISLNEHADSLLLFIFNRGSSYFNVARTTVLHMFCRMANH